VTVTNGNVNAQQYIDILDKQLCSVICKHFPTGDIIFQDDNDPIYRASILSEYTARNALHSMLWPAQSPDIFIIENIWYRINNINGRDVQRKNVVNNVEKSNLT